MRVTTAQLREIARVGGTGWRPPDPNATIVTPASIRKKALEIYHAEGHSAALAYLAGRRPGVKGLAGSYGPRGSREQQGIRTSRAFDRYVRHDVADGRAYIETGLAAEVPIGRHVVAAIADVVLFDPDGHAGRLLSWDQQGVQRDVAHVMAAGALLMLDQELGDLLTVDVGVWDVEHNRIFTVLRDEALAAVPQLVRLLDLAEHGRP